MKSKSIICILVLAMLSLLCSCGAKTSVKSTASPAAKTSTPSASPKATADAVVPTDNVIKAELEMENGDIIKIDLYPDVAPITVANFVKLANEGFYNNLIFHRVISGFMIQGGGYDKDMKPAQTDTIKGEFKQNGVENNLKHTRGVLSMARTSASMDSASGQFFIMHNDSPHLDGQYAAFGKVTEGIDIIDKIAAVKTGTYQNMTDVPEKPQIIKTIRIMQ